MEGPSDEAALGTIMTDYFSNEFIHFQVVHGDITSDNESSIETIVKRISDIIDDVQCKYHYLCDDMIQIVHLVDLDGTFIPEGAVREEDVEEVKYYEDHIGTTNRDRICARNRRKAEILFKLYRTGRIRDIPYRLYYNSCNLEHVLYGELKNFTDEEKQIMSDDFADTYDGKVEEFIEFISDPAIIYDGKYAETWKFVQKDLNSLKRYSNMFLIFREVGKNYKNENI